MKHYDSTRIAAFKAEVNRIASFGRVKPAQVEQLNRNLEAIPPAKYTKTMAAAMDDTVTYKSLQACMIALTAINDRAAKLA